jgi:GTP-binding nuclear protein Ran
MTESTVPRFKVVLIGDAGVGKTTFVKRHTSGEFERKYLPTVGVNVSKLLFYTNIGPVVLDMWDTAGQEKFGGLRDGYYISAHAAIIMFDVTSKSTYRNVPVWYRDINRIAENIPVVLVGNKVDVAVMNRQVKPKNIIFHRKKGMQYYDLSAKSNYNYEKPILYLIKQLYKKQTGKEMMVQFVKEPSLYPPEITIDPRIIQESNKFMEEALQVPIPEDDEDEMSNK